MWECSKCGRIFKSARQPHTCKKVPLGKHFEGKEKARKLFDALVEKINSEIGKCKVISLPCCIHLFGKYDFLAALPKKDRLEVRFAMDRELGGTRIKACVPMSAKVFKNCLDVYGESEIDKELMGWLKQSYGLRG